jgi:hypothetical protein
MNNTATTKAGLTTMIRENVGGSGWDIWLLRSGLQVVRCIHVDGSKTAAREAADELLAGVR